MIVRINGRELIVEPSPVVVCSLPEKEALLLATDYGTQTIINRFQALVTTTMEAFTKLSTNIGSMVLAGAVLPASDGLTQRLWPLIGKMQDFGLFIGIGFGLWGVYMIMVGNPEGKQKLIQALIGFIGLYIVPEAFMAIRDAFR